MSLFKRWSNRYIRKIVLAAVFTLLIITITLIMLSASLKCVDNNGCIKDTCQYF